MKHDAFPKPGDSHKRMKPKKARPTKEQREFAAFVREHPCFGCGRVGVESHHTLLRFEGKAMRRDHWWQLPACVECHRGMNGIHGIGSEVKWLARWDKTKAEAIEYMRGLFARFRRRRDG